MLKRIKAAIRERLLKVDWIQLEIEAYKNLQQKKRDDQLFAKLVHLGGTIHDPENSHRTLATVCDRGIYVDYMDGRFVGQRHVTPIFIDSTNWGVEKNSEDLKRHSSNSIDVRPSTFEENVRITANYARVYASANTNCGPCSAEQS